MEAWRTDVSELTIQALVTRNGDLYGVGTEVCTIDPASGEVRVVYDGDGLTAIPRPN